MFLPPNFGIDDQFISFFFNNTEWIRIRSGGVIYEDVGPGGIVGEMALVEHYPARSATVTPSAPAGGSYFRFT